jgi:hypothetical protein
VAVDKILEIRSGEQSMVTPTRIPKINFEAEHWSRLINVSSLQCHQPPCVRHFTNEELEAMKDVCAEAPNYPLHSQTVERAVKLTSEASTKYYIWQKRHNFIVAKNKCRKQRPHFRSKSDYM